MIVLILVTATAIFTSALLARIAIRRRNLHLWLGGYIVGEVRRGLRPIKRTELPLHVLLCIADHFEPLWGGASEELAAQRVDTWIRKYPEQLGKFRDSDGRPPRHTFFYPIDQYDARHVEAIAGLCRAGYGEVEIHLHHDHDTAENLERTLLAWTERLADRHGLLGRWPDGRIAYGFVHGNWALDNSRPDRRWCGVENELEVLQRTGCYADFTMPSAPDVTQTRTINSIYYAKGSCRPKSHDEGVDAGSGRAPEDSLLLIQGPLRLWRPRGVLPRIENGCIQASQPPSMRRLEEWIRAGVGVRTRPDWVFIKLHTHGATEANQRILLGEPMVSFHAALEARSRSDPHFRFHYVTAREMHNVVKHAEAGYAGPISGALDGPVSPCRPHNRKHPENSARSVDLRSPHPATNR